MGSIYLLYAFYVGSMWVLCAFYMPSMWVVSRWASPTLIQASNRLRQVCHPCEGMCEGMGSMADGAVIGKKWFAFSRMEIGAEALLKKI